MSETVNEALSEVGWFGALLLEFSGMSPASQVALIATVLGALGFSIFGLFAAKSRVPNAESDEGQAPGSQSIVNLDASNHEEDSHVSSTSSFRWLYQWEAGDNILPRAVDPPLEDAIAGEIAQAARQGKEYHLIFVRGELGIGKTTLLSLLPGALKKAAEEFDEASVVERNLIQTTTLIEADDLTSPQNFSSQVIEAMADDGALVVFARPATLDIAARRISVAPSKVVNMLPFEPTGPLFHECLAIVAERTGLKEESQRKQLGNVASRFDKFLKTPFYFEQAARAIKTQQAKESSHFSPLEIFRTAIEYRANEAGISFDMLLEVSVGQRTLSSYEILPGITGDGQFVHDGYRNVILASGVVSGKLKFEEAVSCDNAIPAIRIVLSHLEAIYRLNKDKTQIRLLENIRRYIKNCATADPSHFPIYISGLAAASFRKMKDEQPAELLRNICIRLIEEREKIEDQLTNDQFTLWWDISDALSEIGDPRLRRAKNDGYSPDSDYFCPVTELCIPIGSDIEPERTDNAKPVLCYKRTSVHVGEMWVANYLVTNEQFLEFWDSTDRSEYFTGTGRQWIERDPCLLRRIEEIFDLTTRRNFWKELSEHESVTVQARRFSALSPLELARRRATRPHHIDQVPLWDPIKADRRFSANGQPVVGVNWWEALAYCKWWEQNKLKNSKLPAGSTVSLMTDWEWEAIRRYAYEEENLGSERKFRVDRYAAHTRAPSELLQSGRIGNVTRPLHVGLSLPTRSSCPTDLVGNVWEWTRSRVFGEILPSDEIDETFGNTTWSDGDCLKEKEPAPSGRDTIDEKSDLFYRAVRGGSFFSKDAQAAWHPAYRLCDSPFSSYIDLGFRIAVYPPKPSAEHHSR